MFDSFYKEMEAEKAAENGGASNSSGTKRKPGKANYCNY